MRPRITLLLLPALFILGTGCPTVPSGDSPEDASGIFRTEPRAASEGASLPEIRGEGLTPHEINSMTVYRDNIRSIVNITTVSLSGSRFMGTYAAEGSGSGVIISPDGYILTNRHVVNNADYVVVTLFDGSNYQARTVGSDAENDLAVLKFDPAERKLPAITPGRAGSLQVGQKVLALGNPFGLEGTLTTGIVSGLNRPLQTPDGFLLKGMIQTDAAINPGNSGGALLNSKGELVGINTLILSPEGSGSIGIGFAIPIETVQRIAPELIRNGRVIRGWIDMEALTITPGLASQWGVPFGDYGVMVTAVLRGGNAEKAGLRGGTQRRGVGLGLNSVALGGDIIVRINGEPIRNVLDYFSVLEESRPGDLYRIDYLREGKLSSLTVELSERPLH